MWVVWHITLGWSWLADRLPWLTPFIQCTVWRVSRLAKPKSTTRGGSCKGWQQTARVSSIKCVCVACIFGKQEAQGRVSKAVDWVNEWVSAESIEIKELLRGDLPEKRGGGTGVNKIVARVIASDVGEPERSLRIYCHPWRVNAAESAVAVLHHPVDGRFGPAIGRLAAKAEWRTLLRWNGHRWFVLERIQVRFADKHRIGCRSTPFVGRETLILTC